MGFTEATRRLKPGYKRTGVGGFWWMPAREKMEEQRPPVGGRTPLKVELSFRIASSYVKLLKSSRIQVLRL